MVDTELKSEYSLEIEAMRSAHKAITALPVDAWPRVMKWLTSRIEQDRLWLLEHPHQWDTHAQHAIPTESGDHETDPSCWCNPVKSNGIWVHNEK